MEKRDLSSQKAARGLVQIFTGDGKGKTSAALGTVLRALGHDWKVHITFFLKGDYPYGERRTLAQLPNVTISSFGQESFVQPGKIKPEEREQAQAALACAREAMLSGKYDMLVLDEAIVAVHFGLIGLDELLRLIQAKPRSVELILTGRKADPQLVQAADLVTEMVNIKHPYDSGIPARLGSEY